MFEKRLQEAFAALGCFNLAVFGKTGVGKSTLVNAIFGRDVAATGVGQPVTRGLVYYRHPDGFLGLYDSEGFETGTSGDAIVDGLRRLVADHRTRAVDQRIHAAWYLVRWSDRRFEGAQEQFVRELDALGLPAIMVMTQVPNRDGQVHPEARQFADYIESLGMPLRPNGRVVLTNALVDDFSGSPQFGLQTLLDDTYDVVPEVVARALTAAQVVDIGRKKKEVAAIINQAVMVAAGVGATPIPFADAALLVPNQVTMIARITAAYGLPPNRSKALAAAGSVVLTGGATMAGRYAVTSLLKLVPGGALAGSAISATVAGALTKAVGMAWSRVCEQALAMPPVRGFRRALAG
ncbi:MAG: YcjF family protein, partial [Myxococcota bacterium]